jgi:hypothetical protein
MTTVIEVKISSDSNINYLNTEIVKAVKKAHGIDINPQPVEAVRSVVYNEYHKWYHDRTAMYEPQFTVMDYINMLNKRTINFAVSNIVTNYFNKKRYESEYGKNPLPLKRQVNVSSVGIDIVELK